MPNVWHHTTPLHVLLERPRQSRDIASFDRQGPPRNPQMHRPPPPAASLAPMQAATRSIIEAGKASKATDSLAAVADSLKKVGMGRRGTGSPAAARFRKGALATEAAAAQLRKGALSPVRALRDEGTRLRMGSPIGRRSERRSVVARNAAAGAAARNAVGASGAAVPARRSSGAAMGMAPRRRGNHLVHVPVAALGKPVDGSDGRWAQSKPITVSASEAIANADVKIREVTTERRMLEGMILAQPKPMIASGMPTATTAATFADATRVQLGGDALSGTPALADGAAAPAGRRAKHGRRARAASAELAGATTVGIAEQEQTPIQVEVRPATSPTWMHRFGRGGRRSDRLAALAEGADEEAPPSTAVGWGETTVMTFHE